MESGFHKLKGSCGRCGRSYSLVWLVPGEVGVMICPSCGLVFVNWEGGPGQAVVCLDDWLAFVLDTAGALQPGPDDRPSKPKDTLDLVLEQFIEEAKRG